jgi:excisionase family DNA binding protein
MKDAAQSSTLGARQDGLVGYDEARQILGGVSAVTVWRLERAGQITPVRIGRRVLFRRSDLAELIERRRIPTQAKVA